ncbi:SubName: Full=Uncharacterized protein {ECO:0000313/EMBL:CCA68424.1} [Serendipita indica DSM 11827]|uniref:NadR/Ttd14 AAA domain-containing protein n=1 Tax=Serendipita indica (strain DSM 11827) TaxID=1109443 RepID=G4TAS3_SERID|nr:SubName: Full=Uncharacterized protein {ECO:0000313/EMBL:CCA68424.1} [Serendipita indica DSM 11827]CCA68424.1 hypothetical protein PIIN_02288 [Serendipita indica DSM 11827]
MREQGFTRKDVGTLEMQRAILRAQLHAEENALTYLMSNIRRKRPQDDGSSVSVLLCDRCAIDPIVYATMELPGNLVDDLMTEYGLRDALARYSGRSKASTKGNFSEKGTYIDPLVILTDGVDEWRVDDGVRSLYDPKTVAVTFRDVLARLKISHLELGENIKDIEERVAWVMTASGLKD